MPSSPESAENAETMRQAARALVRSSRAFPDPAEMYDVLGSVTYTLGALSQSLTQLGIWHGDHRHQAAHDDGDRHAGAADASTVAASLQRAVIALDVAVDAVMAAHNANGRIAWHPDTTAIDSALNERSAHLETAAATAETVSVPQGRRLG